MAESPLKIFDADTPDGVAAASDLFLEYQHELGVDLCFQGFAKELAELPGAYARPAGRLLLAYWGGTLAGCGALRPLDESACEMKRLYVRPAFRRFGIGRAFTDLLITQARAIGYRSIRLDTLARMEAARAIYRATGFREIGPYYPNPLPGVICMELALS